MSVTDRGGCQAARVDICVIVVHLSIGLVAAVRAVHAVVVVTTAAAAATPTPPPLLLLPKHRRRRCFSDNTRRYAKYSITA